MLVLSELTIYIKLISLYFNKTIFRLTVTFFLLSVFGLPYLKGQDVHLSQYEVAPLQINPANTGDFQEDLRITGGYRKQWTNVGTPFLNYAITADAPIRIGDSKIGVGFMFLHDDLTLQQFKTTQFMGSFSYERLVAGYLVRAGLQAGYWTRGYSNDGITMPEQYNMYTGYYDPNLPISDYPLLTDISTIDINIGVSATKVYNGMRATAGFAAHHINVPNISFGDYPLRLPLLWSFNADIITQPLSWLSVRPSLLVRQQQTYDEGVAGALARTTNNWTVHNLNSIAFGAYVRSALFENIDAVILSAGVHYANFEIFYTYDINVSSFKKATNGNGASEIGIVYKIKRNKNNFVQPCITL